MTERQYTDYELPDDEYKKGRPRIYLHLEFLDPRGYPCEEFWIAAKNEYTDPDGFAGIFMQLGDEIREYLSLKYDVYEDKEMTLPEPMLKLMRAVQKAILDFAKENPTIISDEIELQGDEDIYVKLLNLGTIHISADFDDTDPETHRDLKVKP